jgi:hypothetical protein
MKNSEAIQRVQSLYSRGVQSDSSRLSERHIFNKLITVRSKLLGQKLNKKQKLSQWNYQTLPCVKMVEAPLHECPCLPPVGCKILKSDQPIPEPLTDLDSHIFQSVTSIDGSIIYSEVSWTEKQHKSGGKYTSNKPDFFIRNNYLYITYKDGPEVISVTGIFEDFIAADIFPSYCDDPDCTTCLDCESYLDKEFVADNDLVDTMVEMAAQELINIFGQMLEDRSADSKDTEDQRLK